jgi:hypothetical protein
VGKAKVMSYEDIKMAQAKRAANEAIKDDAGVKGKRGRKRRNSTSVVKAKKARKSEVEVAEDEIAAVGMEDYCSVIQF